MFSMEKCQAGSNDSAMLQSLVQCYVVNTLLNFNYDLFLRHLS